MHPWLWIAVCEEFTNICTTLKVPVPKLEYSDNGECMTSKELVKMTNDADPQHVFGHYLSILHEAEPDLVADVIGSLLGKLGRIELEGHSMGLD